MSLSPGTAVAWLRSPLGQRAVRYSAVSAISIVVSQAVLWLTFDMLRLGSGAECNLIATAVATVPSYNLNRKWAWGRSGSSHLWREIVPFWSVAFIGLAFSTLAVFVAQHVSEAAGFSHFVTSLVINGANLGSYGLLWVGKFVFFNVWLFKADQSQQVVQVPIAVGD